MKHLQARGTSNSKHEFRFQTGLEKGLELCTVNNKMPKL